MDRTTRLAQGNAMWNKIVTELIEVRRIIALSHMLLFLKQYTYLDNSENSTSLY